MTGESAGRRIDLDADSTVIGRAPDCAEVLDSLTVSRRHAELRRAGEGFAVVDLHSRGGTKLNGRALDSGVPYPVAANDRIEIGDVVFAFDPATPMPMESARSEPADELQLDDWADVSSLALLVTPPSIIGPGVKPPAIHDVARGLASEPESDAVGPKVLDGLMQHFPQAERASFVLVEAGSGLLIRKAFRRREPGPGRPASADESPMAIDRSIVGQVIGQRRAVLSQGVAGDENLSAAASLADRGVRSVMCAPLLTPDGRVLGVIQLDASDRKPFLQDDLDVLAAVAGQAVIALQNASLRESLLGRERLDSELKFAEQVQRRFLPQSLPKIPGYEFFAEYRAANGVGGDFYDFAPLPGGRLGIAVGDVSGKGMAAALVMARFSGDARLRLLAEGSPSAAMGAMNDALCAAGIEEAFITLSLSVLEPATGRLQLCSAGFAPVLVRRANGTVEELGGEVAGLPLGVLPGIKYEAIEVELRPGDVAVVCSDGVAGSQSPSAESYDTTENRRLLRRVRATPGGAEAVGGAILREIREFSRGHAQADDITLVTLGPTSPSPVPDWSAADLR